MKITVVSLWAQKLFDPEEPQPFGGAELQLALLSKELVKRPDVEIRFITRGWGPRKVFESEGIRIHKLPNRSAPWERSALGGIDLIARPLLRSGWGGWELFRTLLSPETDVFIQRGGGIETGITGLASRYKQKPFLFMLSHDWDADRTHETKRGFIYGRSYLYGLNRAAAIVAQSQYQRDLLQANYGRESYILRSSHTIPADVPAEKRGVLWVGRCETWKNPEAFLRLAERLPDVSFTMVCPNANSPSLFERIRNWAGKLPNVDFSSGVPFEESEALFARHALFVNTSDREGFPNTFVQACKWGTPILSLNVNPDDLLTEHGMGRCADGDETRLTELCHALLTDRSDWNRLSANARTFAKKNHDVRVNAEKLYSILISLSST